MVVKIKSPFCQGIESASSPGLYSLDVQYFTRTVFPRELGPGGTVFPKEYGPPDRKLGRTVYPMTPAVVTGVRVPPDYASGRLMVLGYDVLR